MEAIAQKDRCETIYRNYIADALKVISESVSKVAGGQYMQTRYHDIIDPPPEETRTPEEIIDNIRNKLRGGE